MNGCGATSPLEPSLGGTAVMVAGCITGGGVGRTGGGSRPIRGMLFRARVLVEDIVFLVVGDSTNDAFGDEACSFDLLMTEDGSEEACANVV